MNNVSIVISIYLRIIPPLISCPSGVRCSFSSCPEVSGNVFISSSTNEDAIYISHFGNVTNSLVVPAGGTTQRLVIAKDVSCLIPGEGSHYPSWDKHPAGHYNLNVLMAGFTSRTEDYQWVKPTGIATKPVEKYLK